MPQHLLKCAVLFFVLTYPPLTSFNSFAAKKCKCDEEAIINRESKDASWNQLIHEGCAAIQNKDYNEASEKLTEALKIGEDSYISGLLECSNMLKGTAGATSTKPEDVKTTPPPPVTEPEVAKEPAAATPEPAKTTPAAPVASSAPIPEIVAEDVPSKSEVRTFTAEELSSFQAKGMLKVNTFKNYLNKIGNKSTSLTEGIDAINNAMKLFYGNTFVQVSSTSRDTKPKFPTKTYLERVRALNYDRVDIEWAECQYASNLKKAPDGNYYGYIKFRQRFKGIKDGKVIYEDITDKTIAVVLRAYDKAVEGEKVENFDIFLGDIDVVQTMKN